jgi:hypothetical protein
MKFMGWLGYSLIALIFGPVFLLLGLLVFFYTTGTEPFCTYDVAYRLTATIEAGGQQTTSQAVRRVMRTRKAFQWLGQCQGAAGKAIAFRLPDNRLVLARASVCPHATDQFMDGRDEYPGARAMRERTTIDVTRFCFGLSRVSARSVEAPDAFLIDNADRPRRWRPFFFDQPMAGTGEVIRLVSATAQAIDRFPTDNLERIAPAILETYFKQDTQKGSQFSPAAILDFKRPYGPDKRFAFEAEEQ